MQHLENQKGTDLLKLRVLTQSPLQCGQGPRAGAIKFPIWCASNFLENPIALFWCVLDGVTTTMTGVQGIKTFGVESGDKLRNGWTAFTTGTSNGSGEIQAVCNSGANGPLGAIL